MAVTLLRSAKRYLQRGDAQREAAIARFAAAQYDDTVTAAAEAAAEYIDALLWQQHYGTPPDPQVRSAMLRMVDPHEETLSRDYFALYRASQDRSVERLDRQAAERAIETVNRVQQYVTKALGEGNDGARVDR